MSLKRPALLALLFLCLAAPVRAQDSGSSGGIAAGPDLSKVRVRLGPLYLNPTLALTNAGIDKNVFNDPDDGNPQQDFTATITPHTDIWMRAGPTWLEGLINEDIVWYRRFASERSVNNDYQAYWLVPLSRLSFKVGGDWLSTRSRPGFEIDARDQRTEDAASGAMEIRALSKTYIGFQGERRTIAFAEDSVYLGVNLHDELNRVQTTGAVTIRNELTPLTNLVVDIGEEQDRFNFDHSRDSNSTQVSAGLKFDQLALVKGGIQFGFRDFKPLSQGLPGFTGLTTAVDVTYVLLGSTRFAFGTTRDIQYSYEVDQPYYVQTAVTASVAQQLYGPFDVQARVGAGRLAYMNRVGATDVVNNRVDTTSTYGGGVGYHIGQDVRLGFNLDENKRQSVVEGHTYHDLQFGTAVTYGF
jgi:hypothetical protein